MKAKEFTGLFERFSKVMEENRRYLIQLDSVVGDGDLGLTMDDGFKAAYHAVRDSEESDIGPIGGAPKHISSAFGVNSCSRPVSCLNCCKFLTDCIRTIQKRYLL